MASGTCAICDAATATADRYCSACGADLAATVVEIGRPDRPGAPDAPVGHARSSDRLRTITVVTCVILVGATLWFLSSGSGAPDPDAAVSAPTTRPAEPTTPPSRAADPTDDRSSADGLDATAPSARAFASTNTAPVDTTLLPNLDASHVAIAAGQELHILDLRTGSWTSRGLQNTPSAMYGVDGGVVMAGFVGGWLAFAPADGGQPVALGSAENELLRVDDRGIVVRRWTATPPEIVSIALDGRQRWRFGPPAGTSAIGVTSDGEVLVQAAQTIVAVDPISGATRPITDGVGFGVSADVLVIRRCDADLTCRTDQLRVDTGERRLLAEELLLVEPAGDQVFRAFARGGVDQARAYRLVDGWLERVNEARPERRNRVAVDPAGVAVSVEDSTLVFRTGDGTVEATITSPVQRGAAKVALVPAAIRP